jgi:uncharacterized membrane protein
LPIESWPARRSRIRPSPGAGTAIPGGAYSPSRWLRWATVAALAAALVTGGLHYRQIQYDKAERERAQGEAAKQRLMLALRIASSKLQLAKSKVIEINAEQTAHHVEKE